MTIIWSPLAIQKVTEIAKYIAQDNAPAAVRWTDIIFEKVEKLIQFPQSGRIVPEINREHIREILYKNYRIIYRLETQAINILTVRHGKQILPSEEIPHTTM